MKYLQQAWLVLALALLFGASLAGVYVALADKIQANKLDETLRQIPALVEGASNGQATEVAGRTVYRALDAEGKQVGWVVPASGQGFADTIELLIGLDCQAGNIKGLYVLSQKETPGLGSKVTESRFLQGFAGKSTDSPLSVTKAASPGAGEILAVTGATVSSESVTQIVNKNITQLRSELASAAQLRP